jgi:cytochrome c-type biogenesis protein CcmH/NrfG
LLLDHVGYEGSQDHKRDRDMPLLRRKLKDDPDHVYSWWHLGRILVADGKVEEARAAWHQRRRGGAAAHVPLLGRQPRLCRADQLDFDHAR